VVTLQAIAATRVIDQDALHDLRRHAEAMSPVLPAHLPLTEQPNQHRFDDLGGLQRVAIRFILQRPQRDTMHLRHHRAGQTVGGPGHAIAQIAEQSG